MYGHSKRRRRSSTSLQEQRKVIRRNTEDNKLTTSLNGSFRIQIDLRSQSKAKRNNPRSPRDWKEFLQGTREKDGTDTQTANISADQNIELTRTKDVIPLEQLYSQKLEYLTATSQSSSSGPSEEYDQDEQNSSENDLDGDPWDDSSAYDSEYDEFSEFKWLEQMDGKMLWTSPDGSEEVQVGSCSGKLIRRSAIRNIFYDEIEEPSADTSKLGFGLFDRYGRLKPEFKTHPVKKGSGIWRDEFDSGDILLIDYLHVAPPYRRQALGRQVFTDMFEMARKKTRDSLVAVVEPGTLVRESDEEMGDVSDDARKEFYHQTEDIAFKFWRQLGFRRIGSSGWLGHASDPSHACHRLKASDDYDLQLPKGCEPDPVYEAIRRSISTLRDEECVEYVKQESQNMVTGHPLWTATDEQGNTLLHIAAVNCKPNVVKWILQQRSGSNLLDLRNNDGDTPLDALLVRLEAERTKRGSNTFSKIEPCSDRFKGFDPAAVECLAFLRCLPQLSDIERLRITYGCTCGNCTGGFLSPRMSLALLYQAEVNYDMLSQSYDDYSGSEFVEDNEDELQYLRPSVRQNLTTNKSMREGFIAFFEHFATCIKNKELPTEPFIMRAMQSCSEWPPVSRNFLQRGGTVYSVGSTIFDKARLADLWAGDGDHWEIFEDKIQELPCCRNDHEFGFASSMCGFKPVSGIRYVSARTGEPIDDD